MCWIENDLKIGVLKVSGLQKLWLIITSHLRDIKWKVPENSARLVCGEYNHNRAFNRLHNHREFAVEWVLCEGSLKIVKSYQCSHNIPSHVGSPQFASKCVI